jgi:membrane-bound lytic murein transglycosylase A
MLGRALALAALTLGLAGCMPGPPPQPAEEAPISLRPVSFADLEGWGEDRQAEAIPAFLKSCARIMRRADDHAVGPGGVGGVVADWRRVCAEAEALPAGDDAAARAFFESALVPLAVIGKDGPRGLVTGYYEPELAASRLPAPGFAAPIYRRPADIVTVDLGEFRADLDGKTILGRVVEGHLKPYFSRAEIEAGALEGRGDELFWLADPVGAFFLQVQGSGRLQLADGAYVRVGYEGKNGRAYHAIGKTLVERGALAKDDVTAQSIQAWLRANPDQAPEIMNQNASVVFFREVEGDGPIGAQGAVLTPLRSIAIDPEALPLGAPIWLDTTWPPGVPGAGGPLRRLVVAQDTGGVIKGSVRGDLFWGTGDKALAGAGTMKQQGRYFLLLPKAVAARRLAS